MKRRILFVVNHPTFFISHRLDLALQAKEKGFDIYLAAGKDASKTMSKDSIDILNKNKIEFCRCSFASSRFSYKEVIGFFQLFKAIKRIEPDIVHTVTPKGILYGGILARTLNIPSVVYSVSGMGYLFTDLQNSRIRKFLSFLYTKILKFILQHNNSALIVQNEDDKRFFKELTNNSNPIHLIPGSGVDLMKFKFTPYSVAENNVVFPSRLIYQKGLTEFVESAKRLSKDQPEWNFILVGARDYESPDKVKEQDLDSWINSGVVKWLGHQKDMVSVFGSAGIVCLPSYREGMPKSLLEAAAIGRPVITTDTVGCRESLIDKVTGELVKVKDVDSLTSALEKLICNKKLREKYGKQGRKLAEERFDKNKIIKQILKVYDSLIE